MSMIEAETLKAAPTQKQPGKRRGNVRVPLWVYTLIFVFGGWEVYAQLSDNASRLPPFSKVLVALKDLILDGSLLSALFISMQGLLLGFLLSIAVGIVLGLLMGYRPGWDKALTVYMDILTAVPIVALIPLVVVFFGLGLTSRIIVIFLYAIVIIVENTKTGVQDTDPQLVEMARSFGATRRQITVRILLPSAVPFMVAGICLGLGRAVIGMISAEMILSSVGIGNLLMQVTSSFRADQVFAVILSLLAVSVLLITLVQKTEKRFFRQ